jgi:hypothetical protein
MQHITRSTKNQYRHEYSGSTFQQEATLTPFGEDDDEETVVAAVHSYVPVNKSWHFRAEKERSREQSRDAVVQIYEEIEQSISRCDEGFCSSNQSRQHWLKRWY